jgi:integrase
VRTRVDHWEAAGDISARTAARYRELVENQIVPHIGAKVLQKLRTLDIEEWHTTLRSSGRANGKGGLAPRTIGHAHRVLGEALRDAAKNELVVKNVVASQSAPKVDDEEMVIVKDMPAFIELLRGRRLFVLVETLRGFRKEQLEFRLKPGVGKLPDDALLFAGVDAALPSQKRYSKAWSNLADQINMPDLAFHNWRHTHASQLIDEGVDIVTISKRLGHAKPDITLRIYAHLFRKDDGKAAAAINTTLNR